MAYLWSARLGQWSPFASRLKGSLEVKVYKLHCGRPRSAWCASNGASTVSLSTSPVRSEQDRSDLRPFLSAQRACYPRPITDWAHRWSPQCLGKAFSPHSLSLSFSLPLCVALLHTLPEYILADISAEFRASSMKKVLSSVSNSFINCYWFRFRDYFWPETDLLSFRSASYQSCSLLILLHALDGEERSWWTCSN